MPSRRLWRLDKPLIIASCEWSPYLIAMNAYTYMYIITRAMLKHSKASERIASYQFGANIGPINTSETVATCMCMDLQVKTCEPPSLGKPHPLHLINIILLAGIAKDSLARLCK